MKFTAVIGKSVEKINQFGANTGILKSFLELAREGLFEEKYIYIF